MANDKKGLGDLVEQVIESTVPKFAQKAKKSNCNCKKRKEWLNNFGAKFG